MKSRIIYLMIAFCSLSMAVKAQDYSGLNDIALKDKADYSKTEDKVLECSKFILTQPVDTKDPNCKYCMSFIVRWMSGTPDYSFGIDDSVGKLTKSNQLLIGVYMACMNIYVLNNKDKAGDANAVKLNSVSMFLDYCSNPAIKVKPDGELKKALKAKNDNKLKEYLKIN